MGTSDILLGGNPAMDLHLVQLRVAIFLGLLFATETGNKLRPCGSLVRVRLYLYVWHAQGALAQYLHALFGQKETSLYISREKCEHYSIQTRHNNLFFSPLQSFSWKTSRRIGPKISFTKYGRRSGKNIY